jgi:hypothetical protein
MPLSDSQTLNGAGKPPNGSELTGGGNNTDTINREVVETLYEFEIEECLPCQNRNSVKFASTMTPRPRNVVGMHLDPYPWMSRKISDGLSFSPSAGVPSIRHGRPDPIHLWGNSKPEARWRSSGCIVEDQTRGAGSATRPAEVAWPPRFSRA